MLNWLRKWLGIDAQDFRIRRLERAKKERKRGGRPILIGKAYASDKRGKGMQVPLVSKLDRRKIQSDISESVRAFMKKKTGYKKGGDIKKLKTVAAKLQKASKAHKGQSRTLRRIISKYVQVNKIIL